MLKWIPNLLLFLILLANINTVYFWVDAPLLGAELPVCPVEGVWNYNTEFSDEFNDSMLNEERWWDFNPAWLGRKPGFFSRDNVAVKEGNLQLTARCIRPDEKTVEREVRGYNLFATATVKSKKRIKYGYFEARCKSMKASVCNAFWLYDPLDPKDKYVEGHFSEEIDIFEIFGKPTIGGAQRVLFSTVHRLYTPYVESIVKSKAMKLENKSSRYKVDFDFWADYHVYGFLWTPKDLKWFLDGKEVFSRKNDYFHTPLYIMFDCEIMRNWVGDPDPNDLPAVFSIDYLHVWQ